MILKYSLYLLLTLAVFLGIYLYSNLAYDRSVTELSKRWAPEPSKFLNVAGMNIHYRDEGPKSDKAPIVLIHGTSASLHTWDGWVEELKAQRRVIRFDLPAFGLTGPDPQNNYTIEHYAEVVIAVLDKLKVDNSVLAGNSLGGYIAWATAVFYPDRVSKLILVDASGYPYDPESVPLAFKLSQNPIASRLLKNVLPKSLVEKSIKNVYGNPDLVTEELVNRYYELSLREGNRSALKARFEQTLPGALIEKIHTINVPTLLIWGRKDRLIPLKFGKQFEQEIVNSELIVFDDLGHVPHEENPQATVSAVLKFL
ncbi:alpha/beta hydrolase [Colwellia sp. PAMC 21821]|uniref:alpha/beta fold hydrolase n=1 Tax=Colwellia sp. PAMC 21821 TaxID=1816219 RepID=UPI0009C0C557|nr:alpha/beta hydrolase [Colwellia sp. PAMC 21821]ARD45704.1 alpha/beta hydrolase [Colwellia sp. PAMC 21821]